MRLSAIIALTVALLSGDAYSQEKSVSPPREILLSGRLTDSTGASIAGATVVLSSTPPGSVLTAIRTLQNGRFTFAVAPNQSYELHFGAPGFAPVVRPVRTATAWLELGDIILAAGPTSTESPAPLSTQLLRRAALSPDLVRALRGDFRSDQDCLKENGTDVEREIRMEWLDLATGNHEQLLVNGLGPCLAGANNGRLLVYVKAGQRWRKVLDRWGNSITTLSSRTHGYLDLARWQHDSVFASIEVVYQYNGNDYGPVRCNVVRFADITGEVYPTPHREPCAWDWKASERPYGDISPKGK